MTAREATGATRPVPPGRAWLPRSTAARVGIAAFLVLLFNHGFGFVMANLQGRPPGLDHRRADLARAAAAIRALDATRPEDRAVLARTLGDERFPIRVRPRAEPCVDQGPVPPPFQRLARDLNRPAPDLCLSGGEEAMIQVPLKDGGAAVLALAPLGPGPEPWQRPAFWQVAVSLLLAGAAAYGIRALTEPFARFSAAAERLGIDPGAPPMPEAGPMEVVTAIRAFNAMQTRLQRFVADRVQMLAAISHDLRTPITRLRLRAEFVEDPDQQAAINADLDEMETMVLATLDFAKAEHDPEPAAAFDLAAMLDHVCRQRRSVGQNATYAGPERRGYFGRRVALNRAFANLVDNAVIYGGEALVRLREGADGPIVTIEDRGPGIDPRDRERVFRPFTRVDPSRSRQTGGAGLGLAMARGAVRAHGGDITLEDRMGGGLTVVVNLSDQRAGSEADHG